MSRMQELAAAKTAGNVVAVSPPPAASASASHPHKPQIAPAMRSKPDLN